MELTSKQREFLLKPKALPESTHFVNLRSYLPRSQWDIIRKKAYEHAKNKCELCHGVGRKHKVEAHELWNFDFKSKTQTLERIIALCPNCHRIQHAFLLKLHDDKKILNAQYVINHLNKISDKKYNYNNFFSEASDFFSKINVIEWNIMINKEKIF